MPTHILPQSGFELNHPAAKLYSRPYAEIPLRSGPGTLIPPAGAVEVAL
jgi:hypothetical protein